MDKIGFEYNQRELVGTKAVQMHKKGRGSSFERVFVVLGGLCKPNAHRVPRPENHACLGLRCYTTYSLRVNSMQPGFWMNNSRFKFKEHMKGISHQKRLTNTYCTHWCQSIRWLRWRWTVPTFARSQPKWLGVSVWIPSLMGLTTRQKDRDWQTSAVT